MHIGFKNTSYSVQEGEGYLVFVVEVKNDVTSKIPISITVTNTEGGALSEVSALLGLSHVQLVCAFI